MMHVARELEDDISGWIVEREMIAIIGPRQAGKTTLLHRIRDQMVDTGRYDSDHVVMRSLDDEMERQKFEDDPVGYMTGLRVDGGRHLFLLDEVQFARDAGNRLKVVFDRSGDSMKLVFTGSSGLDLRNIGGALVGRVVFFELHPFSFGEFLLARDEAMHRYYLEHRFDPAGDVADEWKAPVHLDRLNRLLGEYMTYGGFPRVTLMDDVKKKETLLRHLITLYIEKDILKVYGGSRRNDALRVIRHLAFHNGGMLNHEDISSELGIDVRRVQETIDMLEDVFILRRLGPFFGNMATELRKRPKVYFLDNGVRNALAGDFVFSREKGFMLEGYVLSRLLRLDPGLRYWRTTSKAEVDFVVNGKVPVEVKSTPRITRALRSFMSAYKPPRALVVNYDVADVRDIDGTKVYFVPAALL
jgi:predicted AAA+ superfamily ATPase